MGMGNRVLAVVVGLDLVILALVSLHWLSLQVTWFARHRGGALATLPSPGQAWPPICVLVPAFNEEQGIEATLRALLSADYGELEVTVINDGSQDRTAQIVAGLAGADRRVSLLTLPQNQGKALALNAGVAAATAEYLVVIDADTVPEPDFLRYMVAPLASGQADAVAGRIKAGHPQSSGLIRVLQSIEYVSVQHMSRLIQACTGSLTMVPGAAGAFRKAALRAAGGYSSQARAEDADLSFRLVEGGFRIVCQPRAAVRTDVPTTWRALLRQRLRWIHGNLQCIFRGKESQRAADHQSRYASLAYVYENLWRPPLEFARASIPVWVLAGVLPVGWMAGWTGLLALNWLVMILSYEAEGEDRRELLYIPVQYAIWPVFLIIPYCLGLWRRVTRA